MSAGTRALSWRGRTISVGAVLALAAAGAAAGANPVSAAPSVTKSSPSHALTAGRYMVTLADEPAATYEGNVSGYARTRPDAGKKLDPTRDVVIKWRAHLTSVHDSALSAVGAVKLADYTVGTNGFSADLTAAQARKLAATAGVTRLQKDSIRHVDFEMTPEFLGLTQPGTGLWAQLGDTGPSGTAGQGVIVGDIDTGIWPESPAFAGSELKRDAAGLPVPASGLRGKWWGPCVQGENFSSQACNSKLIGARYYTAGFGKKDIGKQDYLSPRDGDGHGSHTASTAAGNRVNNVVVDGRNFGVASGMAPGAKIAAYKVCWDGAPGINDGCATSDIVSAIDDAIADGVDVLNMSIGSTTESDPLAVDEQAFRRAANVGIFVANSAGNSGPGASTLDHPSPWITTVAASTFRISEAVVELGDGQRFLGASLTPRLGSKPLVSAASVKLTAAAAVDAARCFAGTLNPTLAAGKIVLCDRGVNARTEKSDEVKRAGGAGMILANTTSPLETVADLHAIPTVHVELAARTAILAYLASATSPSAALVDAHLGESTTQVPEVAGFSSRGPSTSTGGDILKPDLAAPGVDVLAAVAPPFHAGRSYDFVSGTSMASPHIAGLGALLKALHPTWSPAAVKSALMTTGRDHATSADPFAQGAGFVRPNLAASPGLVFDAGPTDYRRYMVGLGVQFAPPNDTLTALSGSDLNQASIAVGSLTGTRTITRTVKSVSSVSETYTVNAVLPGMTVTVTPSSFTVAPGASQALSITITHATATLGNWTKGSMTLTSSAHSVRVPVVVKPVTVAAPNEIHGTGTAGTTTFQVTPGFTGTLSTSVSGLVGATPTASAVSTAPYVLETPTESAGTKKFSLTVPAGTDTKLVRFDVDATSNSDDLDLYVYKDGEFLTYSASGASDEQVTLNDPAPGVYTAYVNGFATPGGGAFAYTQWLVPSADVGNLVVTGAGPVTLATAKTLTASWSGLTSGLRYLGFIAYSGPDGLAPNRTVVSIG
ncbi:MAG: hypothetical protein QOE64_183 [Frankiales bacterium]|jgi:subtilisin family serine protease|nr:hypothetical protein [Frankiales bacterium]